MPECNYCESSFENESTYLDHLDETHRDELGRIDQRRVDTHTEKNDTSGPSMLMIGGVIVAIIIVLAGLVFALQSTGGSGAAAEGQQPTDLWSVHYHGTMEMVVLGEQVDFSRNKYQIQADAFHFEDGRGTQWHGHANSVTLEFALESLGFDVTASTITIDGTSYSDFDADTTVTFFANGDSVTPDEYVLQPNDQLRIVVERA